VEEESAIDREEELLGELVTAVLISIQIYDEPPLTVGREESFFRELIKEEVENDLIKEKRLDEDELRRVAESVNETAIVEDGDVELELFFLTVNNCLLSALCCTL